MRNVLLLVMSVAVIGCTPPTVNPVPQPQTAPAQIYDQCTAQPDLPWCVQVCTTKKDLAWCSKK